ncbi:MAG: hypothetical protein E7D41_07650, partial [Cutibacterium sp.]|nr:hypothetical protein [Cutibacterium sp.]
MTGSPARSHAAATTDVQERGTDASHPKAQLQRATPQSRRRISPLWGTSLFFLYVVAFLVLPTILIAVSAFQDSDGTFSTTNFSVLTAANTVEAFGTSLLVSLASALISAIIGGAAANALEVLSQTRPLLRRLVTSLCSVLAQFGGVMLAFAFIATIGVTGVLTQLLKTMFGVEIDPTWLSTLPGLTLVYCYFQIPLMIIVFLPALDGVRPQWREANAVFGGSTWTYWTKVAGPILWPAFLGSVILLFANAFSSFATAAALFS